MAATSYFMQLSSGQAISVRQKVSAELGYVLPVTLMGVATDNTNTTDFSVMRDAWVTDILTDDGLTSGGFEIYDVTAGARTNIGVNNLSSYHISNTTRRAPPLGFVAGRLYRLIQSVPGNA